MFHRFKLLIGALATSLCGAFFIVGTICGQRSRRPADQNRIQHGAHRPARRRRQIGSRGIADVGGGCERPQRHSRPSGAAHSLRRPVQSVDHVPAIYTKAARHRQGRSGDFRATPPIRLPRRCRLSSRAACCSSRCSERRSTTTSKYDRYFQLHSNGPDAKDANSTGFFAAAMTMNPKPTTVALVGASAEFSQKFARGRAQKTRRNTGSRSSTIAPIHPRRRTTRRSCAPSRRPIRTSSTSRPTPWTPSA